MSEAGKFLHTSTRVRQEGASWRFEMADYEWPQIYPPVRVWRLFRRWQTPPDAERIARAGRAMLADSRFVRRCGRCSKLFVRGNTHNRDTCHGCATKYLGVLY